MKNIIKNIPAFLLMFVFIQCAEREKELEFKDIFETETESTTELDQYLKEEFRDPYGSVIRYKFNNEFIDPDQSATPARLDVVKPIAELIKAAWIEPYNKAANNGEAFLATNFPAEIVLVGSPIFNGDGTRLLGVADSGVRVTVVECNVFDATPGADNSAWIAQTFRTLHHEFAHIVDQNFNFEFDEYIEISGDDYTSPGSWTSLISGGEFSETSINNAITRGMVSAYGTSSVAEDFAEMIAFLITIPEEEFTGTYLTLEDCSTFTADGILACIERNEGRERIQQKVAIITEYMKEDVGIDIAVLRDEFLKQFDDE